MKVTTVVLDARSLAESYTSNHSYWHGLVKALGAIAEPQSLRIILMTNGPSANAETIAQMCGHEYVESRRMPDRYWSLVWLPLQCRRLGADVVHVQYTISPLMMTPAVTTIHDMSYFAHREWFGPRDALFLRTSVPLAARKAAKVITVSEHAKSEIVRFLRTDPKKIEVTPLAPQAGIDRVDNFECVVTTLGVRSPYVLSVGTLQRRKNWPLVIEAFARAAIPGLQLVITGPCRVPREEVITLATKLRVQQNMVLTGGVSVADLAALYSGATALLHPSYYEGFGLTPLEAMRCGCPPVATDGSSIPEVVKGRGILVRGFDPEKWSQALQASVNIQSKDRDELIEHSRQFDWSHTALLTASVYKAIVRVAGTEIIHS